MPFSIVRQDITRMKVDAIVNAANTELAMGGGVCGAIFQAAGAEALQAACNKLAPISTGEAALTPGFNLPAKHIIHAVGPVYRSWDAAQSERLLRSAYLESLKIALRHRCASIAFPLISSGIYGYPKEEALRVATAAIREFLMQHEMDVYLVIFDKSSFAISQKLVGAVESYIDENYVFAHEQPRRILLEVENRAIEEAAPPPMATAPSCMPAGLDALIGNLDEPFHVALLRLIDAKGKNDVEVYKRANIDRKLFSKIRSDAHYRPSKPTAMAFAVALELPLDEARELLEKAGFAFSHASKFDIIVEYFIAHRNYDIFAINEALFAFDQSLLGG